MSASLMLSLILLKTISTHFFAIIGDNILGKTSVNNYFVQEKSKEFFEILENLSGYYFDNKLNPRFSKIQTTDEGIIYKVNNIKDTVVFKKKTKKNGRNNKKKPV